MPYTPPPMKSVQIIATMVAKYHAETGKTSIQWTTPYQLVTGEWLVGYGEGPFPPNSLIKVHAKVCQILHTEDGGKDVKTLEEWTWEFPNSNYVDDVNFTTGDLGALPEAKLPDDHPEQVPPWLKGDDDAAL